ncbi:MAG: sensor histidine kinase, partial [Planctomycetota bacterium]
RRKDGTTFFTETSLKLVSQDKEEHIIAIARDITERKQAEEATALAYRKLEEANRELKEMQGQLVQSEKMASIGQLAAGVAHEMNTPVGFVASNFQTLENYVSKFKSLVEMYDELIGGIEVSEKAQLLDKANAISQSRDDMKIDFVLEDIQGLFDDSKEGLSRVTNIIQNLRDFSRIDQVEEFDEYDINAGIEATLVVARNEIKYHSDVKAKLSKNVPHLYCNASQINQVFLNILLNASQAIKSREKEDKKGTITIRTYVADDHVMCEISDDGRGIDPENLSKIFDPFFTTKSVGSGTGLGLSVSYDIIVNKHKGELFADSTVGKGTTFTIKLPISRKNAGDKQETEKNEKENSIICRR